MTVFGSAVRHFQRLISDESGGSFVDYAIITTVVTIIIGFVMPEVGAFLGGLFTQITAGIDTVATQAQ